MNHLRSIAFYAVMIPLGLVMGVVNLWPYFKEGEHLFTNNYAAQLTEKVLYAHYVRLRFFKEELAAMTPAERETALQLEPPGGVGPRWPQHVDDMHVPWVYMLCFWTTPWLKQTILEFTRIRVKFRVENYYADPAQIYP